MPQKRVENVGLRVPASRRHRFPGVLRRPGHVLPRGIDSTVDELPVDHSHRGEEKLVVPHDFEAVLNEAARPLEAFTGEPPQLLPGPHVALVGAQVVDRPVEQAPFLVRGERELERFHDPAGHVFLNLEEVVRRTLEPLAPNVLVARRIHELHRDADSISRLPHASFENVLDVQLQPERAQVLVGRLQPHGGGARDHAEARDP